MITTDNLMKLAAALVTIAIILAVCVAIAQLVHSSNVG